MRLLVLIRLRRMLERNHWRLQDFKILLLSYIIILFIWLLKAFTSFWFVRAYHILFINKRKCFSYKVVFSVNVISLLKKLGLRKVKS